MTARTGNGFLNGSTSTTSDFIDSIRISDKEKRTASEQTGYPSSKEDIEERLSKIEAKIAVIEQKPTEERVKPESLYEPENKIIKCREIMKKGELYLSEALSSEDELVMESQIDLLV